MQTLIDIQQYFLAINLSILDFKSVDLDKFGVLVSPINLSILDFKCFSVLKC